MRTLVFPFGLPATLSLQADWPTFRHDIRRSAISTEALEPALERHWVHHTAHAPEAAWPLPGEETPRQKTAETKLIRHLAPPWIVNG